MSISKVQRNFQITIPANIRKKVFLKVGDIVDFEVTEEGILVKPMATIDRNQSWFWSKKWQNEEKTVEADFDHGDVLESEGLESFFDDLEKE